MRRRRKAPTQRHKYPIFSGPMVSSPSHSTSLMYTLSLYYKYHSCRPLQTSRHKCPPLSSLLSPLVCHLLPLPFYVTGYLSAGHGPSSTFSLSLHPFGNDDSNMLYLCSLPRSRLRGYVNNNLRNIDRAPSPPIIILNHQHFNNDSRLTSTRSK